MLQKHGFEHLRIWPRGVDPKLFYPERGSKELRAIWLEGRERADDMTVLLYVGRVSWEKNLRLLTHAYRAMDCLLRGYHEAIEERSPMIAA